MWHETVPFEEPDVAEAEQLGPSLTGGSRVLAGPHCKEECADHQVTHGYILVGEADAG